MNEEEKQAAFVGVLKRLGEVYGNLEHRALDQDDLQKAREITSELTGVIDRRDQVYIHRIDNPQEAIMSIAYISEAGLKAGKGIKPVLFFSSAAPHAASVFWRELPITIIPSLEGELPIFRKDEDDADFNRDVFLNQLGFVIALSRAVDIGKLPAENKVLDFFIPHPEGLIKTSIRAASPVDKEDTATQSFLWRFNAESGKGMMGGAAGEWSPQTHITLESIVPMDRLSMPMFQLWRETIDLFMNDGAVLGNAIDAYSRDSFGVLKPAQRHELDSFISRLSGFMADGGYAKKIRQAVRELGQATLS